ncbi:inactive LRR receptor-like serine/threonine-protein kinase BIR2 [Triticum aestivum]|uniref:inactive LRR receptor-like serine/threonine-protein kinase BIR2 n=1 Tax=Triticum aestivum TaxID=4565 RepID=UPI001D02DA23|nr:inactive LRR receptor-like serine/threonine-protein kinase BIR2 [Triticum aestivum]
MDVPLLVPELPPLNSSLCYSGPLSPTLLQEDDAKCLRDVKSDLKDPEGHLSSWTSNTSAGALLSATSPAFSCWNPQESRILAVSLSGFGLQGRIPPALQYCRSVNTVDLSSNALEGQIPPALCDWIPFVVNLDLCGNGLTGPVPSELANCRFLISLKLRDNAFSGQIPASIARLAAQQFLHNEDCMKVCFCVSIPARECLLRSEGAVVAMEASDLFFYYLLLLLGLCSYRALNLSLSWLLLTTGNPLLLTDDEGLLTGCCSNGRRARTNLKCKAMKPSAKL